MNDRQQRAPDLSYELPCDWQAAQPSCGRAGLCWECCCAEVMVTGSCGHQEFRRAFVTCHNSRASCIVTQAELCCNSSFCRLCCSSSPLQCQCRQRMPSTSLRCASLAFTTTRDHHLLRIFRSSRRPKFGPGGLWRQYSLACTSDCSFDKIYHRHREHYASLDRVRRRSLLQSAPCKARRTIELLTSHLLHRLWFWTCLEFGL